VFRPPCFLFFFFSSPLFFGSCVSTSPCSDLVPLGFPSHLLPSILHYELQVVTNCPPDASFVGMSFFSSPHPSFYPVPLAIPLHLPIPLIFLKKGFISRLFFFLWQRFPPQADPLAPLHRQLRTPLFNLFVSPRHSLLEH